MLYFEAISPELGIVGVGSLIYVWHKSIHMNRIASIFILTGALAFQTYDLAAQVQAGIKLGGNYVIFSQTISPEPKNGFDTPTGLGLQFGGYAKIPFSDMVGLRPELGFSFRRIKSENTIVSEKLPLVDQNQQQVGTYIATTDIKNDQRLQYFQLALPLTINPSSNFRLMLGPAIGFLMGGKQNEDKTVTDKGSYTLQGQPTQQFEPEPEFTATKKKGSAATKDFKKAEVAVVVGGGYELDMGLDFDLRFYRAIVPSQDISQPKLRQKGFTNMIELSIGFTFGN